MGTQTQWEEILSTMVIFLHNFNFSPGLDLIQFSYDTHYVGTQKQWEEMPSIMVIFLHIFNSVRDGFN